MIHKTTWESPDGNTRNQIDHIAIRRKFRTSLNDVRVRRGADIASDHELIIGKIRLKLAKIKKRKRRAQRLDVEKLKLPKYVDAFKVELRNRFRVLEDDVSDVEESWSKYKKAYEETGQKILGKRKKVNKEWITDDSWKTIEERKNIKHDVNSAKSMRLKERKREEYREADKKVKRTIRKDKRLYIDNLASEAEEVAKKGHQGTLYTIFNIINFIAT